MTDIADELGKLESILNKLDKCHKCNNYLTHEIDFDQEGDDFDGEVGHNKDCPILIK